MRPIYNALTDDEFKNQIQFHMPGHLRGRGLAKIDISPAIDVTELSETDNLHEPTGVIKESQDKAAEVFGAQCAYYMVNGSTGGVLAMVLGFVHDGDKIIADRCCHKSFVSALMLSGAEPIWIYPEMTANGAMWGSITPEDVERAAVMNPDAKAVYITAPNYFGMMGDVKKIADTAHKHNMALLVDGAHGAHFGMYDKLPPSIISLGANAVCMSLHKTLPALTQSAILLTDKHYQRVEAALRAVQSSSPSYLLMASCENAVEFYNEGCKHGWDMLYENIMRLFPQQALANGKSVKYKDFTRLNIKLGGNPFEAYKRLRSEFNISAECAYGEGIIAIANIFHKKEELEALFHAVGKLQNKKSETVVFTPLRTKALHSPREAFFAKKRRVLLKDAAGKASAEGIMVYPPGIYQVLPGELITQRICEELSLLLKTGAEITGIKESYCLIFDE